MAGDSEIKLLIELIEKSNTYTREKFDSLSEWLGEHVESNRDDFEEIKSLIKEDTKATERLLENALGPMKAKISEHDKDIQEWKTEREKYVKDNVCKINEKKIEDFFSNITKKLIIYNVIFMLIYAVLLYNSNIDVNWTKFLDFFVALKKLF